MISVDKPNSILTLNGDEPPALKIKAPADEMDELVKMYWGNDWSEWGFGKDGLLELKGLQRLVIVTTSDTQFS